MPTSARCWDFDRPSVGADDLGGPNPRPSSIVKRTDSHVGPLGLLGMTKDQDCHCEERSDAAIRIPRPQGSLVQRELSAKGRLRDCPRSLDTLGMISAAIPTQFLSSAGADAPLCAAGQGNRGGSPQPPVGHDAPACRPSSPLRGA